MKEVAMMKETTKCEDAEPDATDSPLYVIKQF